ncbi:MAG TPA: hypothetical protein DC049_07750 [Spirochaetia bacterium]|nr:hypothetical protein [Spirochaetia bacterium]
MMSNDSVIYGLGLSYRIYLKQPRNISTYGMSVSVSNAILNFDGELESGYICNAARWRLSSANFFTGGEIVIIPGTKFSVSESGNIENSRVRVDNFTVNIGTGKISYPAGTVVSFAQNGLVDNIDSHSMPGIYEVYSHSNLHSPISLDCMKIRELNVESFTNGNYQVELETGQSILLGGVVNKITNAGIKVSIIENSIVEIKASLSNYFTLNVNNNFFSASKIKFKRNFEICEIWGVTAPLLRGKKTSIYNLSDAEIFLNKDGEIESVAGFLQPFECLVIHKKLQLSYIEFISSGEIKSVGLDGAALFSKLPAPWDKIKIIMLDFYESGGIESVYPEDNTILFEGKTYKNCNCVNFKKDGKVKSLVIIENGQRVEKNIE